MVPVSLKLGLDVVDRVRRLDLERDRLAGERLDEDLDQAQRRLLLDVEVGEGAQALQVGRNALPVLDLGLDVVDRVGRLDLEGDGLAGERLDEDLQD